MAPPQKQQQQQQHTLSGSEQSSLAAVPITMQRPAPEHLDEVMDNPGKPRANITVDKEHPHGTYTPPDDQTVLQQHMDFWDRDNDGTVWPSDTFRGFRDLGFPWILAFIAVPIIHGTFSYWTLDSWIPHLGFPIRFKNAHKTKHGSDSEIYDTEGRFVPEKFEEIFSKYDSGNKGGLNLKDINRMIKGNANIMDFVGQMAAWLEWNVSFYLAARDTPHGKILLKEDVRGIIDGTLFHKIARDIKAGLLKRTSIFRAGLSPRTAPAPASAGAGAGVPSMAEIKAGAAGMAETARKKVEEMAEKVQEATGRAMPAQMRKEQ